MSATASSSTAPQEDSSNLPKGVVLDKDGKPCRLCTSAASWRAMTKQAKASDSQSQSQFQSQESQPKPSAIPKSIASAAAAASTLPSSKAECPPDVEGLGRSTWTLLHSLAASYPEKANQEQQTEMGTFMRLFSKLYPCWVCADDFRTWMAEDGGRNQPRLGGRSDFGNWLCEAHNEVNRKLGKKEFDCRFWEQRWRTGWKDGRCDE